MIRFQPDTFLDALLRYFAMVAPNGHVYVEIPAPDVRFAAVVLLAIAALALRRRLVASPRAVAGLLLLLLATTFSWLITTGNGRYFMTMLVCVGPLAVGLIYMLPLTRAFQGFLTAVLLTSQIGVMVLNPPWDAWSWMSWADGPYIDLEQRAAALEPATYVTVSSISYSLIAPLFPASSRWVNITASGGARRDQSWTQDFLRAGRSWKLVIPTLPSQTSSDGRPTKGMQRALNEMLAPQRLALLAGAHCELLHSRRLSEFNGRNADADVRARSGFWVCPLQYPVNPPAIPLSRMMGADAVFARIEALCPRFFRPGEAQTVPVVGGAARQYASSDMKLYVMDDGEVLYKYWRALNPVVLGYRTEILAGAAKIRCDNFRGRSGLPWEREI